MLRLVGLILLATAGWVFYAKRSEASASMTDVPVSGGGNSGAQASGPVAYLEIVRRVLAETGAPFTAALIMGIMQKESSFNPRAYRAEPQINDASYGLMQVLYSTARDRGYGGAPDGLYDPEISIRLGIAQLEWSRQYLAARMGPPSESQLLSSYNAGVGYVMKGGDRMAYVRDVQRYAANWSDRA